MSRAHPLALCRMDAGLVRRIADGDRLAGVAGGAALAIVLGAGAYGAAFGVWRAPEQALYSAMKLPTLFVAVIATTTMLAAMLAVLLRARIGLRQSAVCALLGLATTATILGALAPVAATLSLMVPPPDPDVLGLPLSDPRAAAANRTAQSILLAHVTTIAVAGVLGNLRLASLLTRLDGRAQVARRVLVAWLGAELLVGSELSWMLRPFLCRPHRLPELVSDEMFEGSFAEEVLDALTHALGVEGLVVLGALTVAVLATAWLFGRGDGTRVELELGARALLARTDEGSFAVPWERVRGTRARASTVAFDDGHELVVEVEGGPARRLVARFATEAERDAVRDAVERRRRIPVGEGPFRAVSAIPP